LSGGIYSATLRPLCFAKQAGLRRNILGQNNSSEAKEPILLLLRRRIKMEKRIYFHDTDAGGVVYYGNYLKYLEEARTEFLEDKGLSVSDFQKRGLFYAVRKCLITYRTPARYGEILLCDAHLKKLTAAQLIFDQSIWEKQARRLVVQAEVSLVCLNQNFEPTSIPEDIKARLAG